MASQDEPGGGSAFERQQRRTEHLRSLLDEIEKRRQQAESEGLNFTAPTTEQLEEKLRRARSRSSGFRAGAARRLAMGRSATP
jgi:hypothetical protein